MSATRDRAVCPQSSPSPSERAKLLVVDGESPLRDLLTRKLSALGHSCDSCPDGAEALRKLTEQHYDLMLADVNTHGMEGLTLLKESLKVRPDLAAIMVTVVRDIALAVECIQAGAYDYIAKPLGLNEVAASVTRALERRRLYIENRLYRDDLENQIRRQTQRLDNTLTELRSTYHATLEALGTALDSRDCASAGHSLRVMKYAALIARSAGIPGPQIRSIEQAALLHDIGKIGIPDSLIHKPGSLTEEEWVLMRRHPEIGHRILSGIKELEEAARIVLEHQELYDGTGYPAGLRGQQITLGARIVCLADTLDCMTSDRSFQKAVSFETARDQIAGMAGTQLDPQIVAAFLALPLDEFRRLRDEVTRHPAVGVAALIGETSFGS